MCGTMWEIPDRYPGDTDRESRSCDTHGIYEDEIEDDINRESDGEYFNTFLDSSDTGEYLEIDLEEEITNDKECWVLEDNPGHTEFVSKQNCRNFRSKDEHEHARYNTQDWEILVKERPDGTNLVFVPLGVELGNNREEEADNRRNYDKRDSDNTEIIGIISGISRSEEVDDELHIDLSENGSDVNREHDPEGVFDNLFYKIGIIDSFGIFQVWDIVGPIHEIWSDDNSRDNSINPCPCIGDEIPIICHPESECKEDDEYHSKKFYSFLETGILTHAKYGNIDIMEIEPKEKQTKNLDDPSCFLGMEIVFCEPSGWEE